MSRINVSKLINAVLGTVAVLAVEAAVVTFNMHAIPHSAATMPFGIGLTFASIFAIRRIVTIRTASRKRAAELRYQRTLAGQALRERERLTNTWLNQQARADHQARLRR